MASVFLSPPSGSEPLYQVGQPRGAPYFLPSPRRRPLSITWALYQLLNLSSATPVAGGRACVQPLCPALSCPGWDMEPRAGWEQAGKHSLVGRLVVGGAPDAMSSELLGSEQQCGLCWSSQPEPQFPQLDHRIPSDSSGIFKRPSVSPGVSLKHSRSFRFGPVYGSASFWDNNVH